MAEFRPAMARTLRFDIVLAWSVALGCAAACGASGEFTGGDAGTEYASGDSGKASGSSSGGGGDSSVTDTGASGDGPATTCSTCPTGYACGTANGLAVCRAASGIPLFTNVYVVLMENTSLATLTPAMTGGTAPNLEALAKKYATGSDYHGVSHPSLPNYIALTSGGTQGVGCDGHPQADAGSCNALDCNLLLGSCSCLTTAMNLADQLEAAQLTWMDFGEDMGTPCNLVDSGNYAVRHNPFLYYEDVQGNMSRCTSHVVDYKAFDPTHPAKFDFIAPNLVDDMHNPDPTNSTNIPDGDKWIGPNVGAILASSGYTSGGLVVVVWDEDDGSGGITGTDDPVPIFVMSPYAKGNGYVSATKGDHYALLATIEDGLGVGRLGSAMGATPLVDYFPAN
jgi:hypothetical protein